MDYVQEKAEGSIMAGAVKSMGVGATTGKVMEEGMKMAVDYDGTLESVGNTLGDQAADSINDKIDNSSKASGLPAQLKMKKGARAASKVSKLFPVGTRVSAEYQDGEWYPVRVAKVFDGSQYLLNWDDGDEEDRVKSANLVRAVNA